MKLLNAEFVTSVAPGRVPGRSDAPEIALVGRSNVGKSSLLNALCRRKVARTSAAPGKTRLANIYRVSLDSGPGGPGRWSVYLVDLPGYGYARGGAQGAEELRAVSEAYFASAHRRAGGSATLLLIDSRQPGLAADISAARWLDGLGIRRQVVATKIDKLSRAERARNLRDIEETFGTAVLPVSAASGEGLSELWQTIAKLVRSEAP